jgi:hypothetical protein
MTVENETELEDQETELDENAAPERPESAEETARAVWEEIKARNGEEEEEKPVEAAPPEPEEEKPSEISEAARKLAGAKKKKLQTFVPAETKTGTEERYEPPQNWEVKDKEAFLALPPLAQKNALATLKNWQAQTTKIWQDLHREKDAAKEINQVVDAHWKDLNIPSHMTKGQVIDEFFRYQKKINEDSEGAILEMMQHRGVSLQSLYDRMNGQTAAPVQARQPQQPQQTYLTEEEARRIYRDEANQLNQSREADSATEEVRGLAREIANGRYLWPEMHSQEIIERIQPLVTYFRKTNPQLSWGDTYRKAIGQDRINQGTGSPSPQVSRLTADNIQTVRQASSSLRSRGGNGAISRSSEPKATETARESAEAAYYEIFGNKQH